jgi:dihydroorotate dehydrogenase
MDTYDFIKPLLFKLDPEKSHDLICKLLEINPLTISVKDKPVVVDGLHYKNPIGLAAGFDKHGDLINHIHKLGFGFMEVGTVTPKPQDGHPKPRLFRDIPNESIFNRMGFNNCGVVEMAKKLEKRTNKIIIGGNIGKGMDTPLIDAHKDYLYCFEVLKDLVDYFTINISSPNTSGLRELSKSDYIVKIIDIIQSSNVYRKPIYVKVSPDMEIDELSKLIRICESYGVNGLVVTNTMKSIMGGLSGLRIESYSRQTLIECKKRTTMTIMGSGGLMTKEIVKSRFDDGCDLVQIYTGLIYRGPFFIKKCLEYLD